MLWAAEHGRLDTIKTALSRGADIDANGAASPDDVRRPWSQQTHVIATPLHIALTFHHMDIVEFLLDKGANPHVPSVNLCPCRGVYGAPYALHTALAHSKLEGVAAMLIQRAGAYLLAEKCPVLEMERSIHDRPGAGRQVGRDAWAGAVGCGFAVCDWLEAAGIGCADTGPARIRCQPCL